MKNSREEMKDQKGFESFVDEYLTTKNVLVGLGVASLAGVAAYSTAKALKNERLVNRIKKELNFDNLKSNVNSKVGSLVSRLGFEKGSKDSGKTKDSNKNKKTSEVRSPVKSVKKSTKAKTKSK